MRGGRWTPAWAQVPPRPRQAGGRLPRLTESSNFLVILCFSVRASLVKDM